MISQLNEQFSRTNSAMAPECLFEKISNFKNMNIFYIAFKHAIWRFRIFNYSLFILVMCIRLQRISNPRKFVKYIKSENESLKKRINCSKIAIAW